ncbi:hypothetical protein BH09MYX1_BH09MYX1_38250 [soil metagenome]
MTRDQWNGARFHRSTRAGHYESWFQRANHPSRALAFWIRYTIFCPKNRPEDAIGELWAVYFDGEGKRVLAVKEEHPIIACNFAKDTLDATIADARLDRSSLEGTARANGSSITWALTYDSPHAPLFILPEAMYEGSFPKAKLLVGSPGARYRGHLDVDGERIPIEDWVGSQNHNWGSQHTDAYAWGQVMGFDDAPDAFLEISTAQVAIGPLRTPKMTILVLRLGREELRFDGIAGALRARATYEPFHWAFSLSRRNLRVSGTIAAPPSSFVALPYMNPPGGTKTCLNSKLARCDLTVERNGHERHLSTAHRAAFEILSDEHAPEGVPTLVVQRG